jgi:predicted AAA+ superfamily ATPase
MSGATGLFSRHAEQMAAEALTDTRVVVVNGARQVEVKAAETVRAEDFRGLRHLANRLGDRFRAGIVLYAGEQQLSFGDRLSALPMAALWMLDSLGS